MISAASATDLTQYRWKNRLLLVFAANKSNPSFEVFNQSLSERFHEVKDRDLIVYQVLEKGPSRLGDQPLVPEEAEKLRRHFGVKPGRFTVILVGKDGGVKMVREERADLQEIFDFIDSMPMRQQEMHEKSQSR
jgi:hypothetical protein